MVGNAVAADWAGNLVDGDQEQLVADAMAAAEIAAAAAGAPIDANACTERALERASGRAGLAERWTEGDDLAWAKNLTGDVGPSGYEKYLWNATRPR